MILESLKLHNIRSYKQIQIDFPESSILLSGDIGSGKSTILLAIEFALFGFIKGETSGTTFLRHGENEGSIELFFDVKGKKCVVKRSLKRTNDDVKQTSGYVIINGVKQDLTVMEIKSKILDILGYPIELLSKSKSLIFRYTVFTPQEEMKKILFEDKDLRLDVLRKVFNIDKYKKVRDNASFLVRNLKSKLSNLEGRIYNYNEKIENLKELDLSILKINTEISNFEKELIELKDIINFRRLELIEYEQKLEFFNEIQSKLNVFNSELLDKIKYIQKNNELKSNLELELTSLDKQINLIPVVEVLDESEFVVKLDEIDNKLLILLKQKNDFDSKTEILKKQTLELNSVKLDSDLELKSKLAELIKLEDPSKNIFEVEQKLMSCKVKLSEFDVHINNSLKLQKQITDLDDCPTCLQPVTDVHKGSVLSVEESKLQKYSSDKNVVFEEISVFNEKLVKLNLLNSKYKQAQIEINEIKVKLARQEQINKQYQENLLKIELLKKELSEKVDFSEIDVLNLRKNEIKSKLELIRQNKLLFEKRKNLVVLKEDKFKSLSSVLEENAFLRKRVGEINSIKLDLHSKLDLKVKEEYDLAKKKVDDLLNSEKELLRLLSIKKTQFDNYLISKNKLLDEIKLMDSYKLKIVSYNNYKNFVNDHFINLMTVLEKNIMFNIYSQFNDLFVEWFNILIEDENLNVKLVEDFSPMVEQNGYETSISNLSGGEKTACALAYRLALNKVVNDIQQNIHTKDLIILDEPTDGFSSDQLDKIRDVLEELNMNQVIIVSHENKIESFVENVIKINKNEHISSIHQMS